jgi:hypothetical protein
MNAGKNWSGATTRRAEDGSVPQHIIPSVVRR